VSGLVVLPDAEDEIGANTLKFALSMVKPLKLAASPPSTVTVGLLVDELHTTWVDEEPAPMKSRSLPPVSRHSAYVPPATVMVSPDDAAVIAAARVA
jgi:hypothetical protein